MERAAPGGRRVWGCAVHERRTLRMLAISKAVGMGVDAGSSPHRPDVSYSGIVGEGALRR